MLLSLYKYEVGIAADGICDEHTVSGYIAADNYRKAKDHLKTMHASKGESVLYVTIREVVGLCDVAI